MGLRSFFRATRVASGDTTYTPPARDAGYTRQESPAPDPEDYNRSGRPSGGTAVDGYLQVLGLSSGATDDEISAAYHRLAKAFHPDAHPVSPPGEN